MKNNLNTKQIIDVGPGDIGSGENVFSVTKKNGFIAIGGSNGNVIIKNKLNKNINYKKFDFPIIYLEWDKDDEYLVILLKNMNTIGLWEPFSPQNNFLNIEFVSNEIPTFARWARKHPIVAIGSNKGSILFYNTKTDKKIPTVAKHSKSIITGDWSEDDLLITSSEDKTVTISKHSSETSELKNDIGTNINVEYTKIKWTTLLNESNAKDLIYIALIKEEQTLSINYPNLNIYPKKLQFSKAYGKVIDFILYEDNQMVINFSKGKLVFYSIHYGEESKEIAIIRPFSGVANAISCCKISKRLAVAGEGKIKIFSTETFEENKKENILIPAESGKVINISWGLNGNILYISTLNGYSYGILVGSPNLYFYENSIFCYSSSFNEISIFKDNELYTVLKVEYELNQIKINHEKLYILSNNEIYLYLLENLSKEQELEEKKKYKYENIIKKFDINSKGHILLLSESDCLIHLSNKKKDNFINFPKYKDDSTIINAFLNDNFLITIDIDNKINIFFCSNYNKIISHKWESKIEFIQPNPTGNKIFLQINSKGYIWICSRNWIIEIKNYTPNINNLLWDNIEKNIFITIKNEIIDTYVINQNYWERTICEKVMEITDITEIDSVENESAETILEKDVIVWELNNGKIKWFKKGYFEVYKEELTSHKFEYYEKSTNKDDNTCLTYIYRNIALYNYTNCIEPLLILNNNQLYESLGRLSMESLDFDTSIIFYNKLKNISIVTSINNLKNKMDIDLLKAGVAIILNKFETAIEIYKKRKLYKECYELMIDIHLWDEALEIATKHFPDKVSFIKKKLAYSFEIKNDYTKAINYYKEAIVEDIERNEKNKLKLKKIENHNDQCKLGIARNSIYSGNLIKAFDITSTMTKNEYKLEIADLLFSNKKYSDSAKIYEKLKKYDEAFNSNLWDNNLIKCNDLVDFIQNKFYLSNYAEKLEKKLEYEQALKYYIKAEEWLACIKINLNNYNNLDKAKEIFEKNPSENLALVIAEFCDKKNNNEDSIKYLILAGKNSLAFTKSFTNNLIDVYVDNLEDFNEKESLKIAQYYEGNNEYGKAAKFYELSFNYINSFDCYIKTNEDKYINNMIEMVSQSQLDELYDKLLDFLYGEETNQPKDPIFLFKLYLKYNKKDEALKIALVLIEKELQDSQFKACHELLYYIYKELKENNSKLSFEIYHKMIIIHSYTLFKPWIKLKSHDKSSRLLNRISKYITYFTNNEIGILTLAIIESSKAGFKKMAYNWATTICKPEYRNQINPKYRDRIERLALRPVRDEDEEKETPCPFCRTGLKEYELNCNKCGNDIPFCIASGKHMIEADCTQCPNCKFPAIKSEFVEFLSDSENSCPLCYYKVKVNELEIINNSKEYLKEKTLEGFSKIN